VLQFARSILNPQFRVYSTPGPSRTREGSTKAVVSRQPLYNNDAIKVILSNHARRRLYQRGLGESDIEAVIRRPQRPGRDENGNPIYRGTVNGIAVAVVVRRGSTPPFVITVFLD
jgi:hypothetical protein